VVKSRHVFVCKDGRALPEWLKLPGHVECVATSGFTPARLTVSDIVWIRVSAGEALPGLGLDLIRQLPVSIATVVMSDIPRDEQALAVFSAGARGYCNSHSNSKVLKLIAGVVQDGGLWIGPSQRLVAGIGKKLESQISERSGSGLPAILTGREQEVAEAISGGASNKEVARLLQISERTVKAHVNTLFNKLNVRDRLQLTITIKGLK
jgi:DNA-binding NarL/FixJ family response regulator